MTVGAGILLIAVGVLLAVFVNTTVGVILAVLGLVGIALGATGYGPTRGRREVVIERERPVSREVVREREV